MHRLSDGIAALDISRVDTVKEHYQCNDIGEAIRHALKYYAFDYKSIERILEARVKPRTLESLRNEKASRALKKTLPEIKQRSLENYSHLLIPDNEENNDGKISKSGPYDSRLFKETEIDRDP